MFSIELKHISVVSKPKGGIKRSLSESAVNVFFTVLLAGSTSSVAYLLDPAIKELFINQEKSLILIIPALIILAFAIKGASLYLAKVIMINVSENNAKKLNLQLSSIVPANSWTRGPRFKKVHV